MRGRPDDPRRDPGLRRACSALAAIVAIVVRPLRLPYSVALVLVGLGAGIVETIAIAGPLPAIPPEVVLVVLLPGLVFEAGYRLDLTHLRRSFAPLAPPGRAGRAHLGRGRRGRCSTS